MEVVIDQELAKQQNIKQSQVLRIDLNQKAQLQQYKLQQKNLDEPNLSNYEVFQENADDISSISNLDKQSNLQLEFRQERKNTPIENNTITDKMDIVIQNQHQKQVSHKTEPKKSSEEQDVSTKYNLEIVDQKGDQLIIFDFLILIKMITPLNIVKKIQDLYIMNKKVYNFLNLVWLFLIIVFSGHIMALLFLGIASLEQFYMKDPNNWITNYDFENLYWLDKYLMSLYFSVTTMTTVGYGDFTPQTNFERLYVIVTQIFSTGLTSFSFNFIGEILKDMNQEFEEFKRENSLLNRYFTKNNVSFYLQNEIRNYFLYKFKEQDNLGKGEQEIIEQKLSNYLREKLKKEVQQHVVEQCKGVFGGFSFHLRETISLIFSAREMEKDEVIFREGEIGENQNQFLYFIESGEVQIYQDSGEQSILEKEKSLQIDLKILGARNYFGELGFITGEPRIASARCLSQVQLYQIERVRFLQILREFPQDYEWFCQIKDSLKMKEIIFNSNQNETTSLIDLKCYGCGQKGHLIKKCPFSHFCLDKEALILRNNFSSIQKRENCERSEEKFLHSLADLQEIQEEATEFQSEFIKEKKKEKKNKNLQRMSSKMEEEDEDQDQDSDQNSQSSQSIFAQKKGIDIMNSLTINQQTFQQELEKFNRQNKRYSTKVLESKKEIRRERRQSSMIVSSRQVETGNQIQKFQRKSFKKLSRFSNENQQNLDQVLSPLKLTKKNSKITKLNKIDENEHENQDSQRQINNREIQDLRKDSFPKNQINLVIKRIVSQEEEKRIETQRFVDANSDTKQNFKFYFPSGNFSWKQVLENVKYFAQKMNPNFSIYGFRNRWKLDRKQFDERINRQKEKLLQNIHYLINQNLTQGNLKQRKISEKDAKTSLIKNISLKKQPTQLYQNISSSNKNFSMEKFQQNLKNSEQIVSDQESSLNIIQSKGLGNSSRRISKDYKQRKSIQNKEISLHRNSSSGQSSIRRIISIQEQQE